jgi:hypothetical protein
MLWRTNLVASGVHARYFNASKRGIKKLWVGDKETVRLGRKETIRRIRNSDKATLSPISCCEFSENVQLENQRLPIICGGALAQ